MKTQNNIATTSNPINVEEIVKCINNQDYTLAVYGESARQISEYYADRYNEPDYTYNPEKQTLNEWVEGNLNFAEFEKDFSFLDPFNPENYNIVTYRTSPSTIQTYLVKNLKIERIQEHLINLGYTDIKFTDNFTKDEFDNLKNLNCIL